MSEAPKKTGLKFTGLFGLFTSPGPNPSSLEGTPSIKKPIVETVIHDEEFTVIEKPCTDKESAVPEFPTQQF